MAYFFPIKMRGNKTTDEIIKNIISKLIIGLNSIGEIIALKASTQRILKIFEPITFPIAISVCFFLAATSEAASSGSDVPRATIVKPIKTSLKPKKRAISEALSTINLPPTNKAIIPPIIYRIDKDVLTSSTFSN